MVQAFPAHGANPALGDGDGVRRLDRRKDDLGTDCAPDVEGPGEPAVTVTDQEPDGASSSSAATRLRACWATHAPVGFAGTPARCTRRLCRWMNSTYSRRRNTVSTVRKSQATMPAAWRRNNRHVVEARRGAGWRPLARRTPCDGAARDTKAKAQQLPADPLVAHRGLSVSSRTIKLRTWSGTGGRPRGMAGWSSVGAHAAMPPKQRLGRDHEDRPLGAGQGGG